jgi:hypothetical protein
MADITYIVNQNNPDNILGVEKFSQADSQLINQFEINTLFNRDSNYVELHILNLGDELLQSEYNYKNYKELSNAQSAGKEGASILTIDPVDDIEKYGYQSGDVKLLYHFLNDLFPVEKEPTEFYIQDISSDRTELKLQTFKLTSQEINKYVQELQNKLNNQPYFSEFRLNFKNNDVFIGVNIDTVEEGGELLIVVKLYEPLPDTYQIKSILSVVEMIADSVAFEVDSNIEIEVPRVNYLRPANFNLDYEESEITPTQYLNYDELFSYPINNTNSQLYSIVSEKGAELSIDHTDYKNFIHFSSAYERLANFKYKLQLLENYSTNLVEIRNATSQSIGITGSINYYEKLTQGILDNLDHYERFLYYVSSSYSWPKSNNTPPYTTIPTSDPIAQSWYINQLTAANKYDSTNLNAVVNTVPSFLKDDSNNVNYLTFVHMIGQHFDNLWIYTKGVSDKYNADNRIDSGISKDLVGELLKNFGVKIYNSNKSVEDLFSSFIGQAYQSGSEVINNYITGSLTGSNTPIQPSSFDTYQKEIHKRIYHNLPLLLKSKGTERGVRALINCFGIPSDILNIKLYGGKNVTERPFYGDSQYYTSSLDKIRLDNTGSEISSNTLSQYTSNTKREGIYTDDIHLIEVGFSPTDNVDNYIVSKSISTETGNGFNIEDYLGDPRNLYQNQYANISSTGDTSSTLKSLTDEIMGDALAYNVTDYIRLIKFFDNTIFKMVKDFVPARSVANTGVIIKPHILQRNKAKSVIPVGEEGLYTGSIDTAFITGSNGSSFGGNNLYDTSYSQGIQTPSGIGILQTHTHNEAKYDGELSGSILTVAGRELNEDNLYKYESFTSENLQITLISEFPPICTINTTYEPLTLSSAGPRNIGNDFTNLGIEGVVFETGSTDITSEASAFTFPNVNYTQYIITASNEDFENCTGTITYNAQYCEITTTGTAPTTIETGSTGFDLTTWFTTGSNTDTSFTASYNSLLEGIPTPTSYIFTQQTGSIVTIIRQDNQIPTCNNTVTVEIIPIPSPFEFFGKYRPGTPCTSSLDIYTSSSKYTIGSGTNAVLVAGANYDGNSYFWYSFDAVEDPPGFYTYAEWETNEDSDIFVETGNLLPEECPPS